MNSNFVNGLIGLVGPEEAEKKSIAMKQAFVGRLTHINALQSPRDVKQVERLHEITIGQDVEPARSDRDERFYPASSVHKASSEMESASNDEEEEIEGDYDSEDNEVMIPRGSPLRELADDRKMDEVEVEGVYSDDELFEGECAHQITVMVHSAYFSSESVLHPSQLSPAASSHSQLAEDDPPPSRPSFPFSYDQGRVGPYALDHEAKDILIPSSMNRFLKEYQRAGARFLYEKYKGQTGAVLGDDMG